MKYEYEELKSTALSEKTPEAIAALAKWFEMFGSRFWNGESYEIDSGNALYPVYIETAPDEYEISGYEIR